MATANAVTTETNAGAEQVRTGIGPNAIIQMANAIKADGNQSELQAIFDDAGLTKYLSNPPGQLIDEKEVIRFHQAVRNRLGNAAYREYALAAGQLTGNYLLANRIPAPVQWLLGKLPRWLAIRLLNKAISRNAWTFVGSGCFHVADTGKTTLLIIEDSPLARGLELPDGACDFYAATFEQLYRKLIDPRLKLTEQCCRASGAEHCQFVLD